MPTLKGGWEDEERTRYTAVVTILVIITITSGTEIDAPLLAEDPTIPQKTGVTGATDAWETPAGASRPLDTALTGAEAQS